MASAVELQTRKVSNMKKSVTLICLLFVASILSSCISKEAATPPAAQGGTTVAEENTVSKEVAKPPAAQGGATVAEENTGSVFDTTLEDGTGFTLTFDRAWSQKYDVIHKPNQMDVYLFKDGVTTDELAFSIKNELKSALDEDEMASLGYSYFCENEQYAFFWRVNDKITDIVEGASYARFSPAEGVVFDMFDLKEAGNYVLDKDSPEAGVTLVYPEGDVYENVVGGYTLSFPESWRDKIVLYVRLGVVFGHIKEFYENSLLPPSDTFFAVASLKDGGPDVKLFDDGTYEQFDQDGGRLYFRRLSDYRNDPFLQDDRELLEEYAYMIDGLPAAFEAMFSISS
jgi:hypothetical protein